MLLFFTALSFPLFLFAFLFPSNERPRPSRKFRASSRKISAITCRGNIRDGKKRDDNSVVGESLDDVAVEIRTRTKRSEEMRGKKSRKKKEYIYIYMRSARRVEYLDDLLDGFSECEEDTRSTMGTNNLAN